MTEIAAIRRRLQSYSIIDSGREGVFDRAVFTAAQMFRVPIAFIGIMDSDRLWFKAQVGLEIKEVPLAVSFCAHIPPGEVLVVEDAAQDARFVDNPLVKGLPYIRFYAGTSLTTPDGLRVGTICVIDRSPKTLMSRQVWQLAQLANSIVTMLEARRPMGEGDDASGLSAP